MGNTTGANSPTAYSPEATTPYGGKKKAAALTRTAPVAGSQETGVFLGTPRRAADLARQQQPAPQKPVQQPAQTGPLPEPPQGPPPNPTADVWASIAASPGASELVREYAAQAAKVPA